MEKLVVGENFSVNHGATVEKDGEEVPAKDVFCAELPAILLGLDAAKSLSKNFFVKMAFSIVINAVEALGEAFCTVK